MHTNRLGKLEQVSLRTAWENEEIDFTPWLARAENLVLLGDTLGLELEIEAVEKGVGPFRADILCKDTATDDWVLIENQLERTDHNHLGQILTYAAGLDAAYVVWIADRFTDEHRAAFDWLNEVTGDDVNFFGLEIELWRIDHSLPAPKFNVVSKPNDWSRAVSRSRPDSGELTETQRLQLEYWRQFRDLVEESSSSITPRKPRPQHWYNFAVGRSGFIIQTVVNTRDGVIGVILVLHDQDAKPHFYLLEDQKEEIEREIGVSLEWHEMINKKQSRIKLIRENTDPTDRSKWEEQQRWLLEKLEAFHAVFAPRIATLDAADYIADEDLEVVS
jgi:hypothetical protein